MSPKAGELLVQEIAPRIRNSLASSVPQVGADDIAELVQDGIAIAAALLVSAEARGKKVSAGNVSYFAAKLMRQGNGNHGDGGPCPCIERAKIKAFYEVPVAHRAK